MKTIEGGPPISSHELDMFERTYDIILPPQYRAFLLYSNGGRPERDLFPVPGCNANSPARIHFFFGLKDPVKSCNLDWNREVFADRIPAHLLAIATTEGVDKICLSLAPDTFGAVYFWDGYDQNAHLYRVASTFTELLQQLQRDEHSPYIQ